MPFVSGCAYVSGPGVRSSQARHDGTHGRHHPQSNLIHLLAAALAAHAATQVSARCHAQGMSVCVCVHHLCVYVNGLCVCVSVQD